MAKKKIDKTAVKIKSLLADNKLIIGTERTLKLLKLGRLKQVYLSANCSDATKDDIMHYSRQTKTEVKNLSYPSEELGVICKKLYSISVIGVLK